jgi:hypothetical protein
MSSEDTRTCRKTGLRLRAVREDRMFRVAETNFGAISAPERTVEEHRTQWGRFDSPGRTIYAAAEREIAYSEVLSPFKRQLGAADPLEADAAALDMTREEFLEVVASEWGERSFMGVGAVPASWRHNRGTYELYATGAGWWINLDHPDTLASLEQAMTSLLVEEGITALTTAILAGENRRITTSIGELLRRCELDDGSQARGLQFRTKFGGSWCRAIWLPNEDEPWEPDIISLSPEPILVSDEALAHAAERFRIRVF